MWIRQLVDAWTQQRRDLRLSEHRPRADLFSSQRVRWAGRGVRPAGRDAHQLRGGQLGGPGHHLHRGALLPGHHRRAPQHRPGRRRPGLRVAGPLHPRRRAAAVQRAARHQGGTGQERPRDVARAALPLQRAALLRRLLGPPAHVGRGAGHVHRLARGAADVRRLHRLPAGCPRHLRQAHRRAVGEAVRVRLRTCAGPCPTDQPVHHAAAAYPPLHLEQAHRHQLRALHQVPPHGRRLHARAGAGARFAMDRADQLGLRDHQPAHLRWLWKPLGIHFRSDFPGRHGGGDGACPAPELRALRVHARPVAGGPGLRLCTCAGHHLVPHPAVGALFLGPGLAFKRMGKDGGGGRV
mmetsp:Transcript_1211/g.3175  ORF Transcript_1211/g.3175 Transcript_1211/m.3175 type:complete len:352 (-) Transcript_1211:1242-2297(-)